MPPGHRQDSKQNCYRRPDGSWLMAEPSHRGAPSGAGSFERPGSQGSLRFALGYKRRPYGPFKPRPILHGWWAALPSWLVASSLMARGSSLMARGLFPHGSWLIPRGSCLTSHGSRLFLGSVISKRANDTPSRAKVFVTWYSGQASRLPSETREESSLM